MGTNPSESDVSRKVGARVRAIRQDRGWRMADLARDCGMPLNTLHKIETGGRRVTVDDLAKLTKGLGINAAALVADPAGVYVGSVVLQDECGAAICTAYVGQVLLPGETVTVRLPTLTVAAA